MLSPFGAAIQRVLGVDPIGSLTDFGTVEGEDVSIDVPVQLLI
jgi:hypothetical protein